MNRFLTILIAAAGFGLTALPGTSSAQADDQSPPSLAAARDLYQRASYDEARAMLDALISAGRVEAEILYYRGLLESDTSTANERYFAEVTRRWPSTEWSDRARFRIAQYRYDTGSYITARGLFGEVAWRQGDSALGQEARYWRGMTYLHSINRADASRDSLRIGLRLVKNAAESATDPSVKGQALLSTAELHLFLGEPDSALVWADRILSAPYLNDFHPRAMLVQARARDRREENDLARALFQAMLTRYPDTLEGREARRWLLENRERLVQARLDTMTAAGVDTLTGMGEEQNWTVQVGAFSRLSNASSLVASLISQGYDAWHDSKRVGGSLYVVVYVGRFATRAEATAFRRDLLADAALEDRNPLVTRIPPA